MVKPCTSISQIVKSEIPKKNPILKCQNKVLGDVFVETKRQVRNPSNITFFLKDKLNEVIGREYVAFEENNSSLIGLFIQVIPKLRQQNLGLGEILRLSSIIFILENKVKEMEIFSKAEAIYFHSKYKFEPEIKNFEERNYALKSLVENCQYENEEFKREAIDILNRISECTLPEEQRELCKETNVLLKKYIQEILKDKDKYKIHPFKFGIRMILKTEEIVKNKTFFNNLFKKYNIDYQI